MKQGFQTVIASVVTSDGRNFKLREPIEYITQSGTSYTIPAGANTDGASTPPAIWFTLPPFGNYWLAAVLHDSAYQNTLLFSGTNTKAALSKADCDLLLKEAMQSLGVSADTVDVIYEGVAVGGWKAFKEDRS